MTCRLCAGTGRVRVFFQWLGFGQGFKTFVKGRERTCVCKLPRW